MEPQAEKHPRSRPYNPEEYQRRKVEYQSYYELNREKILERQRAYREANRTEIAEKDRLRQSSTEARAKQRATRQNGFSGSSPQGPCSQAVDTPSPSEPSSMSSKIRCGICGEAGHNRRSCSKNVAPPASAVPPPKFEDPPPSPPSPPPPPPVPLPPPAPRPPSPPPPPAPRPPSPPQFKERLSPLEFFFTLRPLGAWTTEYRLLRVLYENCPHMFRLDVSPHYSKGESELHDALLVDTGKNPTIYHLYCVVGTNKSGQERKKWTRMTTMSHGRPLVIAEFV